jgi:small subunit ribosomal protein S6
LRTYEALFIIQPEKGEDETQTIVTEVETLITGDGGTIVRSEIWGKRRLAFEVKGQSEGNYVLIRFESDPGFHLKLESYFRLSEVIIRSLVILFDEKTLRLEAEQVRRNEAALLAQSTSRDGDDDDDRPRRPIRIEHPEAAV